MAFSEFSDNVSKNNELNSLIKNNRVPHAIIIESPSDDKRRELADFLSMWAVCTSKDSEMPCGVCTNCIKAKNKSHSDIITAKGSGKTDVISIDEVRAISKDSVIIANEARNKVYLLFDADKRMPATSQNAFLKTLEEPPQNVMFVLTCEKSNTLLSTIRSRSTIFSLTDFSDDNQEAMELASQIALAIIAPKEMSLLLLTARFNQKQTAKESLPCLRNIFRDALLISCGASVDSTNDIPQKLAFKLTKNRILKLIDLINDALTKIDQNVNINLLTTWLCGEFRRIAWQR